MINKNSPSYDRLVGMVESRDIKIQYLKLENKQLKQFIRDLEKKNDYLKLLSQRRS
jgi:cell division protein FtsB